jgi:diaminopimelate decarboxylase
MHRAFWERPGLEVNDGRLAIAGRDAARLARDHGTPLYAFDLWRLREQVEALQAALAGAGLAGCVRLAMKAQREPEVLAFLRALGAPGDSRAVGVDVCSPGELLHGLACGWRADEISFTGTNLSERDLDVILAHPVHVNLDLLSQVRRFGRRGSGRAVGLRVNPRAGAAWKGESESLYSAAKPTKFGIYPEQLDEAVALAGEHGLIIDTVHFHVGDGYLSDGLADLDRACTIVKDLCRRLLDLGCRLREVNAGGGLGIPQLPGEEPLDLDAWAAVLARRFGDLGVTVAVEPGDFLTKDTAILLGEVVSVEDRMGTTFVGLDMGWNVMNDHFIYGMPFPYLLCEKAGAEPVKNVTIAGHINEGDDLWAEDYPLPEVEEGDIIACINVGGYNQAMQMTHCLRPHAGAVYFENRLPASARAEPT